MTCTTRLARYDIVGNRHEYGYDAASQRTQQVFQVGSAIHRMNYTYDAIGQLKSARGFESDGATPRLHEQFGYAYDAAWNLQNRTNNALVQTFNVNNLNELTSVTRNGTLTVAGTATERKAGSGGNPPGVTGVTVSGTGLTSGSAELYENGAWAREGATPADGENSYTATAQDSYGRQDSSAVTVNLPASNTFVYDLNGNLRTNNTRIFDYDDENQLIRVTEPGAWKSEFSYDGLLRRRIRKEFTWSSAIGDWLLTNEVRYVYDGNLVIQERNNQNLPQVTYTRGNDLSGSLQGAGGIGGLLARTENPSTLNSQPSTSAHAYYHADGNGNVTALVNTNGRVMARYSYDPFGNVLTMSGSLAEGNLYRFSSKEFHGNSGLAYYLYRYYSPGLQRWLNQDPLGNIGSLARLSAVLAPDFELDRDGEATQEMVLAAWTRVNLNLHRGIGNNPIDEIDLFGLADSQRTWVCLPEGYLLGIDKYPFRDGVDFEMHLYQHSGSRRNRVELAIINSEGGFGPAHVPKQVRPRDIPRPVRKEIKKVRERFRRAARLRAAGWLQMMPGILEDLDRGYRARENNQSYWEQLKDDVRESPKLNLPWGEVDNLWYCPRAMVVPQPPSRENVFPSPRRAPTQNILRPNEYPAFRSLLALQTRKESPE